MCVCTFSFHAFFCLKSGEFVISLKYVNGKWWKKLYSNHTKDEISWRNADFLNVNCRKLMKLNEWMNEWKNEN